MVIQTISKQYRVIRRLEGSHQIEAYLCSDDQGAVQGRFLVMGLTGNALSKKVIPYFMELSGHKQAGDFLEGFISRGCLWLVFRYYEYPTLAERIKGEFLLDERLEAARSLLDRILSQDLPCYLQYEALNPDNITVSDASEVYFNYLLHQLEYMELCRMEDVQEKLADCMEMLFSRELEEEISEELKEFIKGLRTRQYGGYTDIYRDFRSLYDILVKHKGEGRLKSRGWLVRMWEKFKKLAARLKKLLYAAVIIGLLGVLIYTYLKPEEMPAVRIEFSQIGTLKIKGTETQGKGTEQVEETADTENNTAENNTGNSEENAE